jgi:hypothetical protein
MFALIAYDGHEYYSDSLIVTVLESNFYEGALDPTDTPLAFLREGNNSLVVDKASSTVLSSAVNSEQIAYRLKYTGAEIDNLLDAVANDTIGQSYFENDTLVIK